MSAEAQPWRPSLGAWLEDGAVQFRVWAPAAERVEVELTREPGGAAEYLPMERDGEGFHDLMVEQVQPGARYRYRLDGDGPFPDPASRYQPEGVHGSSEVVDPAFDWSDEGWRGLDRDNVVLYELHVGTFTPDGTFSAAAERLPHLADLGIDAIQVMPVADFPGARNWGYDGVDLFAPSRAYGRPEDLRALVDAAHRLRLGVVLDVVYNHFGPDGAYHARFSPAYFTEAHHTPWGAAINLDQPGSEPVRDFFIESALHWMHEYHMDGFRLDAVHTLIDESEPHFLAEYRERTEAARRPGQPPPLLIAEEHRNLAHVVRARAEGGYGFDVTYSDDFHHESRTILAPTREGYFQDFGGSTEEFATILQQGWLYTGQQSAYHRGRRGTDPLGLALPRFLHYLQNHDQVGNRAFGDRVYHEASPHAFRAATALLLCSGATPSLFMGDEWAAGTPFLYFTDHHEELGRLVKEGRRNEFRDWGAFSDPDLRDRIPDPQAPRTFLASRLDWSEAEREPHASMLRFHRALLRLRHEEPALRWGADSRQLAAAADESTIVLRRERGGHPAVLVVARLTAAGPTGPGARELLRPPEGARWAPVLSTEDEGFVLEPMPFEFDADGDAFWLRFRRPGAIVFRAQPGPPGTSR